MDKDKDKDKVVGMKRPKKAKKGNTGRGSKRGARIDVDVDRKRD